jgi:hypothetical protein
MVYLEAKQSQGLFYSQLVPKRTSKISKIQIATCKVQFIWVNVKFLSYWFASSFFFIKRWHLRM